MDIWKQTLDWLIFFSGYLIFLFVSVSPLSDNWSVIVMLDTSAVHRTV